MGQRLASLFAAPVAGVLLLLLVFVFFVVLNRHVELDGRETGDFEIGAAFRATQLIAFVNVEFIDFDFSIALRTSSHTFLSVCVERSVWQEDG